MFHFIWEELLMIILLRCLLPTFHTPHEPPTPQFQYVMQKFTPASVLLKAMYMYMYMNIYINACWCRDAQWKQEIALEYYLGYYHNPVRPSLHSYFYMYLDTGLHKIMLVFLTRWMGAVLVFWSEAPDISSCPRWQAYNLQHTV